MPDIRYAARTLVRNPVFAGSAILCLALGSGATTAIFSVVNAVLLRPLPYADSARLVRVFSEFPNQTSSASSAGFRHFWISPPEFFELRRDTHFWHSLEAWINRPVNLAGESEPVRATASFVTGGLLPMLGVSPVLGRVLTPADDVPNVPATAVLSYDLWQRAFGGDPRILERDVRLNGRRCTVVGVMPRGFQFPLGEPEPNGLWVPVQLDPAATNRGSHFLSVLARLAPGVTLSQAQAEMQRYVIQTGQTVAQARHRFDPRDHPIVLAGFQDEIVHSVRPAMLVLLGAVAFVMLIACVNVANLLLARSESRRREIAVRTAIGAGAWRLLRQFLAEGLLLSLAGAVLGIGLAAAGLRLLAATGAANIPRASEISIDWRVLLFSLAIAVATGVVFGVAPILHSRASTLHLTLKAAAGRTTASAAANRFRAALVASEIALALVLLIGSGLMIKAFWKLQEVNPGIDPTRLLTVQLSLPSATYTTEVQADGFWSSLLARVRALPGVESATLTADLPPAREVDANTTFIENLDPALGGPAPTVDYYQRVDPAYFRTVRARLVEGRFLTDGDGKGAAPVIVINQAMARAFWPGESAIGHRVKVEGRPEAQWRTIVGVIGDIKNGGLDKPTGTELYMPYSQLSTVPAVNNFIRNGALVVRAKSDPLSLSGPIRAVLRSLDPTIPAANQFTMDEMISRSVSRPRFLTLVMTVFSTLSLVLAALGIYGLISYAVAQRTAEIGIRMALGAESGQVLWLVASSVLRIAAAGTAAGALGAFALTRFLSGLLFGVSSLDVPTFVAMSGVLTAVTLLACYVPARRAARIQPTVALRYE